MAGATAVLDYTASKPVPAVLCPNCGSYCPVRSPADLGDANQRRIAELEAQVELLKKTAVDHEARPTTASSSPTRSDAGSSNHHYHHARPTTPSTSAASRFGSLLGQAGRKLSGSGASNPQNTPTTTPTITSSLAVHSPEQLPSQTSAHELAAKLAKEQEMRQRAEGKAAQMSVELEDLSVSLFQQANEMVAAERKARAKLEERVMILERRDGEKRERLERLERALKRIDRVKGVLRNEVT